MRLLFLLQHLAEITSSCFFSFSKSTWDFWEKGREKHHGLSYQPQNYNTQLFILLLLMLLLLCLMHQHKSGNNVSGDSQLTQAETTKMKVMFGKEKAHQRIVLDVVSTYLCGDSSHNSAEALQYSSQRATMTAFLLLSDLLIHFI